MLINAIVYGAAIPIILLVMDTCDQYMVPVMSVVVMIAIFLIQVIYPTIIKPCLEE